MVERVTTEVAFAELAIAFTERVLEVFYPVAKNY